MKGYYKISDFADKLGKHTNTVDRWFNDMERRRIHYVNRSEEGVKIYDDLDLSVGQFILDRREESWNLPAIYNKLEELFDLRPFPDDETGLPQVSNFDAIRRQLAEDMKQIVQEEVRVQLEKVVHGVMNQVEEIVKQLPRVEDIAASLPQPRDPAVERQARVAEMITIERIKGQLRKEALHRWSTKPENERMKRMGLFGFKKEEDHAARDLFVQGYIDDHFAERLAQEYGIK